METSRGTYSESVIRRLLVLLSSYVSKIIEFRIISRFSILCLCFSFSFLSSSLSPFWRVSVAWMVVAN